MLDEQCEATSTKTHAIQDESEDNINPDEGTPNVTDSTAPVQQTTTRCSGRTRRVPQHFGDYVTGKELENLALHCDALISSGLSSNTADALADPNWTPAMDREFKSLKENGVWELVKPLSGRGIISGKWHFAHKLDDKGNVVRVQGAIRGTGVHSDNSPCLLTLTRSGHKCWILIWVDDIFYGSTDNQFTTWFIDKMSERFNIGGSGPLTWFLGFFLQVW